MQWVFSLLTSIYSLELKVTIKGTITITLGRCPLLIYKIYQQLQLTNSLTMPMICMTEEDYLPYSAIN